MGINQIQAQQTSPFERLVGAVQGVTGTINNINDLKRKAMEDRLREEAIDPNSEISQTAAKAYAKATGTTVDSPMSLYVLEKTFGPLADFGAQSRKFAQEKELLGLKGAQEKDIAALKIKQEKPTASQFSAGAFAERASQAEKIFSDLQNKGFDPTGSSASLQRGLQELPGIGGLARGFTGSQVKEQEQAERNFVNAVLRKESGAAISPSEFDSAAKQYFPRYGDSPEVLAQKEQNRQTVISSLTAEGGSALSKIREARGKSPDLNKLSASDLVGDRSKSLKTGPHGPSVIQNGHVYNWNPQTGQYE